MSDIAPITSSPAARVEGARAVAGYQRSARSDAPSVRGGQDRVEVSPVSTYLAKLRLLPAVRHDLVDSIRDQIGRGGYDTPEKLDAALDEMISDV